MSRSNAEAQASLGGDSFLSGLRACQAVAGSSPPSEGWAFAFQRSVSSGGDADDTPQERLTAESARLHTAD